MLKRVLNLSLLGGLVAAFATISGTAQAAVEGETAYVFNTFSFLVHGFLVMWMAAGFAMLGPVWCVVKTRRQFVLRTSRSIRSPVSCTT